MQNAKLIQNIIEGDNLAFKQLIEQNKNIVFYTAMGFVHSKEDAEDITQEVFIKVYNSIAKFKADAKFSTWLYRITVNESLNFLKRNKKASLLQSLDNIFNTHTSKEYNPLEQLEQSELDENLKLAINSLPKNQRIAFVLSKYDDLSQKEIAEIMKKTEGAVEQLLQRAKNNLQKKLKPIVGN